MAFSRRPHTFLVQRNTGADAIPPTTTLINISLGVCNNQVNSGGGMSNESEALIYDYVLFHNEVEDILVGDIITVNHASKVIVGDIKKALKGQLSNRIWYNEISNT